MIECVIFDFDGVIIDSEKVKNDAFRKIFQEFSEEKVDNLIKYHCENGGISRFEKIRFFFEKILNQSISDSECVKYADDFSALTKYELFNPKAIFENSRVLLELLKKNSIPMFIASGGSHKDLIEICEKHGLLHYFKFIQGSPPEKNEVVRSIVEKFSLDPNKTVLIGDSINDYEAALVNSLNFWGFNNENLIKIVGEKCYIKNFTQLKISEKRIEGQLNVV